MTAPARRPSETLAAHLDEVRAIIARYPVSNPRVFGSVARGEDGSGSDLDILVDRGEKLSLFDLARLEMDLENVLGSPVEVMTMEFLAEHMRLEVERDSRAL